MPWGDGVGLDGFGLGSDVFESRRDWSLLVSASLVWMVASY